MRDSILTAALRTRLRKAGIAIRRATPLAGAGESPALRLLLENGGSVKLRLFSTSSAALAVSRFLTAAKRGDLPRLRCVIGRAIVVEYVEGVVLDRRLDGASAAAVERHAAAAGRLLASIHDAGKNLAGSRRRPLDDYGLLLRRVARRLGRRGLLDAPSVRSLTRIAVPEAAAWTMTHGDLCPENLVLTRTGRLRAIDEERIAIRPYAFDLARTVARWPLDAAGEAALVSGYRARGGVPSDYVEQRHFWVATALALTAAYRLHYGLAGLGRARDGLRMLAKRAEAELGSVGADRGRGQSARRENQPPEPASASAAPRNTSRSGRIRGPRS